MYQKIINFIKYHNAFTIILAMVFFGGGIVFAASPEARDGVYSTKETTVSIDNGLIVSADLDNLNFNLRIDSVTEDEKNYYAAYSYQTLAIEDGFWQTKEINKTLTVGKEALGGSDLGLYLAKELGENINYELSYLKRVQKLEIEKGESQKIVTIAYSGLIGRLLDPKTQVIEGYEPVIPEPVPEETPVADEWNPATAADAAPVPPPETPAPVVVSPLAEAPPQAEPAVVSTSTPPVTPLPAEESLPSQATSTPNVDPSPVETPSQTNLPQEATSTPPLAETPPPVAPLPVDEPLQDQATSTPEAYPPLAEAPPQAEPAQ